MPMERDELYSLLAARSEVEHEDGEHVAVTCIIVRFDDVQSSVGANVVVNRAKTLEGAREFSDFVRALGFTFSDERGDPFLMAQLLFERVPIAPRRYRPPCYGLEDLDAFAKAYADIVDAQKAAAPAAA